MKVTNPEKIWQDEHGEWWYGREKDRTRARILNCLHCGVEFATYPSRKQGYCSRQCGGQSGREKRWLSKETGKRGWWAKGMPPEASPRWKGGRRVIRGGYIAIHAPDHPSLQGTKRKYVTEHRLVMEKMLGRFLERGETVHHKNGIRDDNRPENLELWRLHQPPGQRAHEQQHCATCTCFVGKEVKEHRKAYRVV